MSLSNHKTNFVGTAQELINAHKFHCKRETKDSITYFSAEQGIDWKFTAEHVHILMVSEKQRSRVLNVTLYMLLESYDSPSRS